MNIRACATCRYLQTPAGEQPCSTCTGPSLPNWERVPFGTYDGGPAYPRDHRHQGHNGMSLRDHFAGLAMQALAPFVTTPEQNETRAEAVARRSYEYADAMLKARAR